MHIVNNKKRIIYPSQYLPFKIPFNSASFVSHLLPVSLSTALRALHICMDGKMDFHNFAHGRICRKNAQDEE